MAGSDDVELVAMLRQILKRVRLDELERVARLRRNIHADDLIEACAGVPHRSASGSAK